MGNWCQIELYPRKSPFITDSSHNLIHSFSHKKGQIKTWANFECLTRRISFVKETISYTSNCSNIKTKEGRPLEGAKKALLNRMCFWLDRRFMRKHWGHNLTWGMGHSSTSWHFYLFIAIFHLDDNVHKVFTSVEQMV